MRIGRGAKPAMVMSAVLMMVGTCMTALLPTYAMIGVAAPALLVVARLIQGFSAGGEFGSATALLVEQDPGRKGFYSSIQWASSGFACLYCVPACLSGQFGAGADQVSAWGWRIPFLLGTFIGPVAWYIRRKAEESPEFVVSHDRDVRPLR